MNIEDLCIRAEISVNDALQAMLDSKDRTLFIVDAEQRLIGALTDGDVRRALIRGQDLSIEVSEIMAKKPISIVDGTGDKKRRARLLFLKHSLLHLPVIDASGRIIDVIYWKEFLEEPAPVAQAPELLSNSVVIMAGGKGSRLDPFTRILPKPLIPVGGVPVMEAVVRRFFRAGYHQFYATVNYKKETIRAYFDSGELPFSIDWIEEDSALGTAGGLKLLNGKMKESFFVSNCDILMSANLHKLLADHKQSGDLMTLVVYKKPINIPYGVLKINGKKLESFEEKPEMNVTINAGMYVMEPAVLELISDGEALGMNTLIERCKEKSSINTFEIQGPWYDIGDWLDYQRALQDDNSLAELF